MYTPLRLMNQIESMINVQGYPRAKSRVNSLMLSLSKTFWSQSRAEHFVKSKVAWNQARADFKQFPNCMEDARRYSKFYESRIGIAPLDLGDFLFQNHMYLIYDEWSQHKRVYKIDNSVMRQLCEMKVPDKVPMKALAFLPSKCFYIDYNGFCSFCEDAVGTFVTYDIHGGTILWSLTHIIERSRVQGMCTDFALQFTPEDINNLSDIESHISLTAFSDEARNVSFDDNSTTVIYDRQCVSFFINFCLYLFASNSDVEYTERTRQIYKKRNTVRNQLKEVEEFGVGFRNGQNISISKKNIRYTYDKCESNDKIKRAYSSNYRSAHWHKYWVNDEDNPGHKRIVVRWVEGTFVHGNRGADNVNIRKVTE